MIKYKKLVALIILSALLIIATIIYRKNIYKLYIGMTSNIVITFHDTTASQRYYFINEKKNKVYYVDVFNSAKGDIVIAKGNISNDKIEALKKYENESSPFKDKLIIGEGYFTIKYKDEHKTITRYNIMSFDDLDDAINKEYKKIEKTRKY